MIRWKTKPDEDDTGVHSVETSALAELPDLNRDRMFVVGMLRRPGTAAFIEELEMKYFPPDTEENANFELLLVKYPIPELLWAVSVVPDDFEVPIRLLASQHCLYLERVAVPQAMSFSSDEPDGASPAFPIPPRDNVYHLRAVSEPEK